MIKILKFLSGVPRRGRPALCRYAKDNLDESIEIVSNRDSLLRQKRFVNPFGTVRKNSSAVSESWRQYLKAEVIEKIENSICGKMIDEYGYDRVL